MCLVEVCVKGWCMDLSVIARVLLLAAFLASRNPQETDRTTFGNALKGRRKKARQGTDGVDASKPQDIHDMRAVPRAFGLERMLAIYLQILPAVGIARRLTETNPTSQDRVPSSTSGMQQTKSIRIPGVDKSLTDNESVIYSTVCSTTICVKLICCINLGQYFSSPKANCSALSKLGGEICTSGKWRTCVILMLDR